MGESTDMLSVVNRLKGDGCHTHAAAFKSAKPTVVSFLSDLNVTAVCAVKNKHQGSCAHYWSPESPEKVLFFAFV